MVKSELFMKILIMLSISTIAKSEVIENNTTNESEFLINELEHTYIIELNLTCHQPQQIEFYLSNYLK